MTRILWTPLALQDLKSINTVQNLRRIPESGLEEGTRELVVSDFPAYVVIYRVAHNGKIEVLRVWHGAQQR